MTASLVEFSAAVSAIEANTWWRASFTRKPLLQFTYRIEHNKVSITEVPKEPFESLLLSVRKLTMNDSPANMHRIKTRLRQMARHEQDRHWLDLWHSYWRLAFIKDPFEVVVDGRTEVMTPYRVYECFVNGKHFHSNDLRYNLILYGEERPAEIPDPNLFLQNQFHAVTVDLCFAALGLKRFIDNSFSFADLNLFGDAGPVLEFLLVRKDKGKIDEQYLIFNESVKEHGAVKGARW